MKKIKRFITNWVWQLPQHLLALLLIKLLKAEIFCYVDCNVVYIYKREGLGVKLSGVSLGRYILLPDSNCEEVTIKHELGHSKQSEYLGWLYLPVIGIYSAVFCNLWDRWFHKDWTAEARTKWYYSRWCESWADKLGGVKRGE